MSCLLNKSSIDRNWLFESLSQRKLCGKNGFQIFPWLITYCEWTQGNLFKPFFACCFQESGFFPEVRVTWIHCGFTVHIKEVYMQDVHSQQLNPPGGKRRGYGKQVWLLSTTHSYLFHSFSCQVVMMFGMSTQSVVYTDTPPTTQVGDD